MPEHIHAFLNVDDTIQQAIDLDRIKEEREI